MRKKLVIFGVGEQAQLAHYYFTKDSDYDVVAFSVDADYIKEEKFCDLPVVPFENIEDYYDNVNYELFVAVGYSKVNSIRKQKYLMIKSLGYRMASYISSQAIILNERKIGENCFVLENNTIQPFVVIGDNVTLWSGNHIGHHSIIRNHVFIASHAVISGGVDIGEQSFIGVNATLRDHITIGPRCVIGAGVLLLNNAKADSVYIGTRTKESKLLSTKLREI